MPFESKNVLITGGLGFIGSSLARRLVELGAKVTLVDSLIPEYNGNLWNVESRLGCGSISLMFGLTLFF